jgi:hypothetical protein
MSKLDYKALCDKPSIRGGPSRFDAETQKRRTHEQKVRASVAVARARVALANLHPEDHRDLYEQALAEVYEERGPLPGDEVS